MSAEYEAALEVQGAIAALAEEVDLLRDRLATLVFVAALYVRGVTPMGTGEWQWLTEVIHLAMPTILRKQAPPVDSAAGGA